MLAVGILPLRRPRIWLSMSGCDVFRAFAHTGQDTRFQRRHPGHPDEIETRVAGHASRLDRKAACVEDRHLHQTVVIGKARRPDDGRDASRFQIQFLNNWLLVPVAKFRQLLFWSVDTDYGCKLPEWHDG